MVFEKNFKKFILYIDIVAFEKISDVELSKVEI